MGRERKEEEGIFFFTCCFSHFTLNCFLFISSPLLTSILSSCLSFLRSPLSLISYVSQYFNLALMLFFHPLLLIDVLLGRKYMGFSHSSTGPIPTPTTHTHSFSVFPPRFPRSHVRGESLEENHPYSTTKYYGCLLELYAARCSVNIDCALLWQHNN